MCEISFESRLLWQLLAAKAELISFPAADSSKPDGTNAISFSQPVYVFMYLSIYISKGVMLAVWLSCLQNPHLLIRLSLSVWAGSNRELSFHSLAENVEWKGNQYTNKTGCHGVNVWIFFGIKSGCGFEATNSHGAAENLTLIRASKIP